MSTASTELRRRLPSRRWWVAAVISFAVVITYSVRPLRFYYYSSLGHRALSKGEFDQAVANFRSAQEVGPRNSVIAFWLARGSRKNGDIEGVRTYLEESKTLGYPDQKRLEREWWLVMAGIGRINEAELHLAEMLRNPGDDGSEICDAFSKGYCLNLRFDAARRLLDAWATEYPRDYRPYLRGAQIYAGNERWALAIGELREALKRAPAEISVQRELGRCLFMNEETDEAEKQLQSVIRQRPSDVPSLMNLAQMAFDRNEHTKSLEYLDKIVAIQPQLFWARLLLAKVHLAMGENARSVQVAESLVAEWPEDLNAQYILAQSLRAAGRLEEAQRHFVIHGELNKNVARIESLAREVTKHPSDPELRFELGSLLLRHTSRSEGVAWLESVFQFTTAHPQAHQVLADYYEKIGNQPLSDQHRQFADTNSSSFSTSNPQAAGNHPQ